MRPAGERKRAYAVKMGAVTINIEEFISKGVLCWTSKEKKSVLLIPWWGNYPPEVESFLSHRGVREVSSQSITRDEASLFRLDTPSIIRVSDIQTRTHVIGFGGERRIRSTDADLIWSTFKRRITCQSARMSQHKSKRQEGYLEFKIRGPHPNNSPHREGIESPLGWSFSRTGPREPFILPGSCYVGFRCGQKGVEMRSIPAFSDICLVSLETSLCGVTPV
jgi:hypothetical protein